ncbi:MAG: aspartate 1-decarboxylase [Verrucomicrobia bacterium]|jgi:aspartate 1-decarboxylase|nr:aspartate 1-decarboxylase [Verrucomicrobiota bacterium]
MQICLLKSKIHRAVVTGSSLNYEGSMTIDSDFMQKVGLLPYEKILCSNLANGSRFETYAIPGEPGSKSIILNGATAHLGKKGDRITIMNFALADQNEAADWTPKVILLDENNDILSERGI